MITPRKKFLNCTLIHPIMEMDITGIDEAAYGYFRKSPSGLSEYEPQCWQESLMRRLLIPE